jgi:hypothetical protein
MAELANFLSSGSQISNGIRKYARKYQSFCPGLATVSRLLLLQIFILKNHLTQCHYHTATERGKDAKNDFNRHSGKDAKHTVTGVPYKASKTVVASSNVCDRLPHLQPRSVDILTKSASPPLKHVNTAGTLTLDELYSFYPLKNGRYTLHCGCDLEEVLLDFFIWKTSQPLSSHSKGLKEEYGTPLAPRQRLYQFITMKTLHFRLDDHLLYDTKGLIRTVVSRRMSLHAAIQETCPEVIAELARLREKEAREREEKEREEKKRQARKPGSGSDSEEEQLQATKTQKGKQRAKYVDLDD